METSNRRVGRNRRRWAAHGSGLIVICLTVLAVLGGLASANSRVLVQVLPSGGDDTDAIQGAFDDCTYRGANCVVELGSGTFHTGLVIVHDFQGTFQGEGAGRTIVETLPNLPVTTLDPFWTKPPSAENRWPDVFVFVDGTFAVSDLTIRVPHFQPTTGWTNFGTPIDALHAAIFVIGDFAEVTVQRVTVEGARGTWDEVGGSPVGFNMINGIFYEGFTLPADFKDPLADLIPLRGTFSASHNSFQTIDNPLAFAILDRASVVARENRFELTAFPFAFIDASDSVLEFSANRAESTVLAGVLAIQGAIKSDLEPSRLTVTENEFDIDDPGTGVLLFEFGTEKTLQAVVRDNEFQLDTSQGGILSAAIGAATIVGNTIRGAGSFGIYLAGGTGIVTRNEVEGMGTGILLEGTDGAIVRGNEVYRSTTFGIAVISGSTGSLIARNEVRRSGEVDLLWDNSGTDNVFRKNECESSSPEGLCNDG